RGGLFSRSTLTFPSSRGASCCVCIGGDWGRWQPCTALFGILVSREKVSSRGVLTLSVVLGLPGAWVLDRISSWVTIPLASADIIAGSVKVVASSRLGGRGRLAPGSRSWLGARS